MREINLCIDCGRRIDYRAQRCKSCAGKFRHPMPRYYNHKCSTSEGYLSVQVRPDNFFYPMTQKNGYALEHRLVMARSLGRNLHRWELVHHKNHIRDDNRIENLQLVSDDRHIQITLLETRIASLEKRIIILEAENILLKGTMADELL